MKILIAEDDTSLRRALVSILQKNNYSVDAVDNGSDALTYLCSDIYDAAILDIMMPGIDGVSVLAHVRAEHRKTPILLLTAKSEIDDKITGLDAGANDYLTKPFDMRELLARLRVLTRKSDVQQNNVLVCGNTSLNTGSFELCPGRQLQAGKQRMSNYAALDAESGRSAFLDPVSRKYLGCGQPRRRKYRLDLYFLSAQEVGSH